MEYLSHQNYKDKLRLSVIMPVYNEERTLLDIIEKIKSINIEKELIIVDDGSNDKTKQILDNFKNSSIKIIRHLYDKGKGTAVRTALEYIDGDIVIIQDADLEYDPGDILKLLKPVKEGKAEVIYGSRFTGERRNMFFWHFIGNQFLTFLTNVLYNTTLSDMETGYKLIKTSILKNLNLKCKRFEFEPEVTAKILKKGIRIYEVPISYAGREYHQGKKITWKDGIPAILTLLKYRFFN